MLDGVVVGDVDDVVDGVTVDWDASHTATSIASRTPSPFLSAVMSLSAGVVTSAVTFD